MVTTGLVVSGLGVLSSICGAVGNIEILKLANLGIKTLLCGGITLGTGLMVLGFTAVIKVNSGDYEYIDQDGFSIDRGEFVYNWDDNEYRLEEEEFRNMSLLDDEDE